MTGRMLISRESYTYSIELPPSKLNTNIQSSQAGPHRNFHVTRQVSCTDTKLILFNFWKPLKHFCQIVHCQPLMVTSDTYKTFVGICDWSSLKLLFTPLLKQKLTAASGDTTQ